MSYRFILVCLVLWLAAVSIYQTHKSLPDNLDYRGEEYRVGGDDVEFLYDLTSMDQDGEQEIEQVIFDALFRYIEQAQRYILIDMFLFNAHAARDSRFHRSLSKELTELLVEKKRSEPGIEIDFITDPVNTIYGGSVAPELEQLLAAGVNVIITNLQPLRDSNFIYSSVWRSFFQWFGNSNQHGLVKHPFSDSAGKVSLRSYLRLLNFKANHRKVFVADHEGSMISMICSANPHGGSSAHSNVAFVVRGEMWRSIYQTEMAVANLSGKMLSPIKTVAKQQKSEPEVAVRIISEYQIKRAILGEIEAAESPDTLRLAHFYISDRDIIGALLAAASRGVNVKVILDPNKDAFGYEKNGIPNRPVADELMTKSNGQIQLRWYDTHGEQFHSKLFLSHRRGQLTAIMGSANLTRRNLDNFNLELDIQVVAAWDSNIARKISDYFNTIWTNDGRVYTVEFETYREQSFTKSVLYRIQERLGLSTF